MKIDSLEAFGDIRGRRAGNVRSVYFVRAEGVCPDYGERIKRLDKRLSADGSCVYRRIDTFPVIRSTEDAEFYGKAADILLTGECPHNILRKKLSEDTVKNIREAVMWVRGEILNARKDYTPTMMKNLAAYMLFVLESVTCLLESGNMARKLVCSGDSGFKAYCFCLFCTALGIDVCMLCTDKSPNVPASLLEKSVPFTVGAFGNVSLPPFEQCRQSADKKEEKPVKNIRRSAPEKKEIPKAPPVVTAPTPAQRRELSFEELARLAVSVVMIAVHDSKGDIASTGSGIAIGRDGYILTNCHVASGGRSFSVRLENEDKIFKTKEIIKYNPDLDMAVIRIDKQLEPLKIYSGGELARGQRVVAIGSPLGMFNSVSDGIISGFRRVEEMDMIQFTAPISGGSSGGALLNMYGEVIGMSTAGIEGGQNLNLAVSFSQIIPFIGGFVK